MTTAKRMKRGQRHDLGATSVHVGTWMDAPGEQHTLQRQSRATGLRVVVHVWHSDALTHNADGTVTPHGDGDATVRLVKGDAWRAPDTFREYAQVSLPVATIDELRAEVDRLMAMEV